MADVSRGSVSSMPNSRSTPPAGQDCDRHPGTLAVKRIQGETDSYGCEYVDMCQTCLDQHAKYVEDHPVVGACDWCKTMFTGLVNRRDAEEGSAGRIYQVCRPCIDKDNAYWAEEAASNQDDDPWIDDDYDD